jgi:hypothetical protein
MNFAQWEFAYVPTTGVRLQCVTFNLHPNVWHGAVVPAHMLRPQGSRQ